MAYNPNNRELTPDEKLKLRQLKELIDAGIATDDMKGEYLHLKRLSEDW
jgi:hypothetical protein